LQPLFPLIVVYRYTVASYDDSRSERIGWWKGDRDGCGRRFFINIDAGDEFGGCGINFDMKRLFFICPVLR
jgi:hypothetical protein